MKNLLFLLSIICVIILSSCEKDVDIKTYTVTLTIDNQTSDFVILHSESILYPTNSDDVHYREDVTYLIGVSTHIYSFKSTQEMRTIWYLTDSLIGISYMLESKPVISDGYVHKYTTQNDSVALIICYR